LAAIAIAIALPSCTKKDAEPEAARLPSSTPASAPAPAAAPALLPAARDPRPDDTLFGLLATEAQSRPRIQPAADDVFAALEKGGLAVADRKQSLGRTYKAAFCTGGYTKDASLAVSVCEYPDDAAAKAGLDAARALFPGMSNRTVAGHKSTLIIVINEKGDAAADARAKRVIALYSAT
jgi:hypothetical protein